MGKRITSPTPPDRLEKWKKNWATPVLLSEAETEAEFDEFTEAFVPNHMHKRFIKTFGVPKAPFGNRFFVDEAVYRNWDTKLSELLPSAADQAEATVIYANSEGMEAHRMRGQTRRTLRDVIIDDWHGACAIVRSQGTVLYLFIEHKMKGVIVLSRGSSAEPIVDQEE